MKIAHLTNHQPTHLPTLKEVRSFDGSGNDLATPSENQKDSVFLRHSPPAYADGIDTPSGHDRPGPREISNAVLEERGRFQDPRNLSGMSWAWGQFLDHDITFTPNPSRPDHNITVPRGDRHFDPNGEGKAIIPFSRSSAAPGTGAGTGKPREQFNSVSGWIDASMVYGSDRERAAALRSFEGGASRQAKTRCSLTTPWVFLTTTPCDDPRSLCL